MLADVSPSAGIDAGLSGILKIFRDIEMLRAPAREAARELIGEFNHYAAGFSLDSRRATG